MKEVEVDSEQKKGDLHH